MCYTQTSAEDVSGRLSDWNILHCFTAEITLLRPGHLSQSVIYIPVCDVHLLLIACCQLCSCSKILLWQIMNSSENLISLKYLVHTRTQTENNCSSTCGFMTSGPSTNLNPHMRQMDALFLVFICCFVTCFCSRLSIVFCHKFLLIHHFNLHNLFASCLHVTIMTCNT